MDHRDVFQFRRDTDDTPIAQQLMRIISNHTIADLSSFELGGKAKNLHALKSLGLNVPPWITIPLEYFHGFVLKGNLQLANDEMIDCIDQFSFEDDINKAIREHFAGIKLFAVRSSGSEEDGKQHSFAGLFESILFVTEEELESAIKKVWKSAFDRRVIAYCDEKKLPSPKGISVIIQEMIPTEVAGVAFGINPMDPSSSEKVITSVWGCGEGIVSGLFDADHYFLKEGKWRMEIANKTDALVYDTTGKNRISRVAIDSDRRKLPCLKEDELNQISAILDRCAEFFGQPQDIEFGILEDKIHVLQSRPVTASTEILKKENHIVWDNSNIIESYPGVTTPLTFSFIRQSYEGAYMQFAAYMGVDEPTLQAQKRIFANTLGLINGRVYYNLRSWYQMLALLPGYKINARFMEKMMGVKERFDLPDHEISKAKAWWQIIKMIVQMSGRYRALPKQRKLFISLLNQTLTEYKKIDFEKKTAYELMQLYLRFEKTLLNNWKAPLLNDFFAMIWFGRLQKKCAEFLANAHPNIHNDLLCGSADIISVQPIHRCIEIATVIEGNSEWKKTFLTKDPQEINDILNTEPYQSLQLLIQSYIHDFGERCIGELKLETISYQQDPRLFIKVIQSYVKQGINTSTTQSGLEEKIRKEAERNINEQLGWYKRQSLLKTLRKARELVSARENLRYERTRAFGIVRAIFSSIGTQFENKGILQNRRDIFYLTIHEIFSFIEGTSVQQDYQALVEVRKKEYDAFKKSSAPAQRISTYGTVYCGNLFDVMITPDHSVQTLRGIGCCPGLITGKVRVITDPHSTHSLEGDILVTSSTDPGWVTLFPSAAGIIVERGSLLSHSAIVSREMGKPCIVSVTGLLHHLKTGDEIQMNGSTGEIHIIKRASE
jgi:rifampicin phosphotransferase